MPCKIDFPVLPYEWDDRGCGQQGWRIRCSADFLDYMEKLKNHERLVCLKGVERILMMILILGG